MKLIQDITPAIDGWGRNYARLEYQRIKWDQLWNAAHFIEIIDEAEQIERNLRKTRPELIPVLDQLKEHARYFGSQK